MPPDDDELIGASQGDLVVRELNTDVPIPLNVVAIQRATARWVASAEVNERVYLALEGIRGKQDATTIDVRLRFSTGATARDQDDFSAGTVGLYGLRRATVSGYGLRFTLDVTPFLRRGCLSATSLPGEVVVSLRLRQALAAPIVIGRLALFFENHRRAESSN
jgi:tyrosinase